MQNSTGDVPGKWRGKNRRRITAIIAIHFPTSPLKIQRFDAVRNFTFIFSVIDQVTKREHPLLKALCATTTAYFTSTSNQHVSPTLIHS
jgi:hypothetical protein